MNKYRTDSTKASSGFSLTHMTDTGWAYPTTVEVEDYYNTNKYTSACMGPNNKTIIMSLERSEGYGDLDLYVSFEHGDQYTIPLNLGPDINTYMSDGTPFYRRMVKPYFSHRKAIMAMVHMMYLCQNDLTKVGLGGPSLSILVHKLTHQNGMPTFQ